MKKMILIVVIVVAVLIMLISCNVLNVSVVDKGTERVSATNLSADQLSRKAFESLLNGDPNKAYQYAKKGVNIDPHHFESNLSIAVAYAHMRNYSKALV